MRLLAYRDAGAMQKKNQPRISRITRIEKSQEQFQSVLSVISVVGIYANFAEKLNFAEHPADIDGAIVARRLDVQEASSQTVRR